VKRIIRKAEAAARLGGGLSTFHEKYVKTGRVKLIYLGRRSVGVLESEIDRLVDELVAESAANPNRRALAPKRGRRHPAKQTIAQAQA
jgi:predicted DNA-binding transcriptional regulator AlpA